MLENIKSRLEANSRLLEEALSEYYKQADKDCVLLNEAQRYGALGGGKRIRAFLTLSIAELLGASKESALPYACAIELMHASSLIHDDMPCMDNDDMRRGKPALHKAYGETLALISGDAMMIKAFECILTNEAISNDINAKAALLLAEAAGDGGMLAGQTIDTVGTQEIKDIDTLIKLHVLKTGKLICAAVLLGCLAAGEKTDSERTRAFFTYAQNIGLAFQIVDDILDYYDGERQINSFITFMSVDEAKAYARKITEEGISAVRSYDDGTLEELAIYLTAREY